MVPHTHHTEIVCRMIPTQAPPQPESLMPGARCTVGPGRHTCGANSWLQLACGGPWMPSLRKRNIFLFCTCLNVRWPGRRLRRKQETTARFSQPALTWKATLDSTGLSKRDGDKGAKDSNRWASRTLALSRWEPLRGGGARAAKLLMSSNERRNPGGRMV